MADDVANEVRRILVNNTIEQVISYNTTIKKDIQQSHEELRHVVGQRYRELILACDKVVGMEDVCRQVLASFKALEGKKQRSSSSAAGTDAAVSTTDSSTSSTTHATAESSSVKDAVLANQLLRRLNSVRALTRAHCYLDAAVSIKAVQGKLADIGRSTPLYARLFEPIERNAEMLLRDTMSSMRRYIVELGKASSIGSVAQTLEPYRDLHSAIELLHACSPSHALSILCDLHIEALAVLELPSTTSLPLEKVLLAACAIYFNLLWYCRGAPSIPAGHASTAVPLSLAALMSSSTELTLEALSLQVVGLRVLSSQPQSAASRLDGWALSPATARPELKIDPADVLRVQAKAEVAIRNLLTQSSHQSVDELQSLHDKMRVAAESLARRLEGSEIQASPFDVNKWNALISAAVQEASKQVLTDLVRSCSDKCLAALDQAAAAASQTQAAVHVTSLSSATAVPHLNNLFTEPSSLFQRSNSFSSSAGPSSPVSPLSPTSRKRGGGGGQSLFSTQELREGLAYLSTAAASSSSEVAIMSLTDNFLAEMVDLVSRRIAKASIEENVLLLLHISAVVESFISCPMLIIVPSEGSNGTTSRFARVAAQFERMYVDSHKLWIAKTAERCASFLHSSGTSYFSWGGEESADGRSSSSSSPSTDMRTALSNGWASHSIEGAVVQYPCRCSPGLSMTLLRLQQEIHSAGTASRLSLVVPALQEALVEKFVEHYSSITKRHVGEDALIQIAFDIVFAGTAFSSAPRVVKSGDVAAVSLLPQRVQQLLAVIEEAVDVVTWSMAFPLLSTAAVNGAITSSLCFGFVGHSSALVITNGSSSSSVDTPIVTVAEVDRFPLLPLSTPTQPKTNLSALLSSTHSSAGHTRDDEKQPLGGGAPRSVKDAASLLAGATKGLRSVLWGEN